MPSGAKGKPLGPMGLGGEPYIRHDDLGLIDEQWPKGAILSLTE